MQVETRNVIYTAIGVILAAMTISVIIFGLSMRSSFARARDAEISGREKAVMNMQYKKYDNGEISGAEVVALIRDYYTEDIDIYVDRDKNNNEWSRSRLSGLNWTATMGTTPAMLIANNNYEYDYHVLVSLFSASEKYSTYLIYDSNNVKDNAKRGIKRQNSWVTGIQVIKK